MLYLLIGIYICLCALVATIGIDRQIGFTTSFLITILTTPIIGLIVTALSNKKVQVINHHPTEVQESENTLATELLKLKELLDNGALTEEEFNTQKVKLLNK